MTRHTPVPTLARRFDPRCNAMDVARLVLAAAVVVHHGLVLTGAPLIKVGEVELGQLAVDSFFIVSGFLVARSAVRLASVGRFLWHRALRLLPGFWVCLLVTGFVVAPLSARLEGHVGPLFTGEDSATRYMTGNAGLLIRQFGVADLYADDAEPGVLNGSLWSLFYEASCYLVLAGVLLWATAVVRHAGGGRAVGGWVPDLAQVVRAGVIAVALLDWVSLFVDRVHPLPAPLMREMLMFFVLGALGWSLGEWIPVLPVLAVPAALLAVWSFQSHHYAAVGGPAFAYLLLVAVTSRSGFRPGWDVSYGLYLYHWPIQRLCGGSAFLAERPIVLISVSLLCTAAVAALSWAFVESPALRRKHLTPGWVASIGARRAYRPVRARR